MLVRFDLRSIPMPLVSIIIFCSMENRSVSPSLNFHRSGSAAAAPVLEPPRIDAATTRTRARPGPFETRRDAPSRPLSVLLARIRFDPFAKRSVLNRIRTPRRGDRPAASIADASGKITTIWVETAGAGTPDASPGPSREASREHASGRRSRIPRSVRPRPLSRTPSPAPVRSRMRYPSATKS